MPYIAFTETYGSHLPVAVSPSSEHAVTAAQNSPATFPQIQVPDLNPFDLGPTASALDQAVRRLTPTRDKAAACSLQVLFSCWLQPPAVLVLFSQ